MNTLLILMALMVVLWFIMPRKKSVYQQLRQSFSMRSSWTSEVPGFLFSGFYYVNFLFVVALFISLIAQQQLQKEHSLVSLSTLLLLTVVVFFAYSLYKLLMIVLTGFIFKTEGLALQQFRLYINSDTITGFVLMPLLLIMLSAQWSSLSYFGFLILLIANIFKWFQTIAIGKSISQFKLYHLIIYLCTLEIIPVLLLLKLIGNLFSEQA